MNRKKFIIIILIILTILVRVMFMNSLKEDDLAQVYDHGASDFEFSLMYNVDGKDFITTFDNQLTVDTVDGIKTIEFMLTEDEKRKIKDKVLALGILNEDYSKLPYSGRRDDHKGIYELVMVVDGIDFKVSWTTNNFPPIGILIIENNKIKEENSEERYSGEFGKLNKLNDLKAFIVNTIIERKEYKTLPAHIMYL